MTLPKLYTLRQVCEAMQVSPDTVWRALRRNPQIRPVGKGRGTRLTLEDYNALIEALRRPPDPIVEKLPPGPIRTKEGINRVRQERAAATRNLLRRIRAQV